MAGPSRAARGSSSLQCDLQWSGTVSGLSITAARAGRHRIYDELYTLGPAGVAALARGLASSDVQLRRNVAVALGALAVGWIYDRYPLRIDISAALPALMTALPRLSP